MKAMSFRFIFVISSYAILQCATKVTKENKPVDFCSLIHKYDSVSLTQALEPVAHLMEKQTGAYVLEDGGTSLVTRARLSEHKSAIFAERYADWLAAGIHVITPNKQAGAGPLDRYRAIRASATAGGGSLQAPRSFGPPSCVRPICSRSGM